MKVTQVRERHKLQFRAELFNAFNHAQFAGPGTQVASPGTFGVISATTTNPRIIQLALKYSF